MAVPDGFFACGGGADVIEGDGDFDQFLSALIARLHQGGASVLVAGLRLYHKVNYIHNHKMITNNLPSPRFSKNKLHKISNI